MLLLSDWHMPTCKGKNKSKPRGKENTSTGTTYFVFFCFSKDEQMNRLLFPWTEQMPLLLTVANSIYVTYYLNNYKEKDKQDQD